MECEWPHINDYFKSMLKSQKAGNLVNKSVIKDI